MKTRHVAASILPLLLVIGEPVVAAAALGFPAAGQVNVGPLDAVLMGSWLITQPDGRGLATLHVQRDGRFNMTLVAGNRVQTGRMEAANGLLRMHPREGQVIEMRYRSLSPNQLEWTDSKGNVTVVRRQFR